MPFESLDWWVHDIGWTIGYLVFVCWLYFFHSPLRERTTAERSEWYAQLMKIIQVWCMVHITFFHLMGHYLDERKEVGPSAVFFPLLTIFLSFFSLFHREKRRLSMGITYGATATMLLMNSLVTAFGLTMHFATCSFQSSLPYIPGVSQVFCPPYDNTRPVSIIAHLAFLGLVFILADYYFKRYHHFNVRRSILWSVAYDLKPATGMTSLEPGEHGNWNQQVHQPGAEPRGEPMVEWYSAFAAGVGLNLAFGSAINLVTVDFRAIEASISPKLFLFGQPPALKKAASSGKPPLIEDQTTDDDEPKHNGTKKTSKAHNKMRRASATRALSEEALTAAGVSKKKASVSNVSFDRLTSPSRAARERKPSGIRQRILGAEAGREVPTDAPATDGGEGLQNPLVPRLTTFPTGSSAEGKDKPAAQEMEDDFWFDFVADIGDGFNSTYEISRLLAQPMLRVTTSAATQFSLSKLTNAARKRWIHMSRRGLFGRGHKRRGSFDGSMSDSQGEKQSPTDSSVDPFASDVVVEGERGVEGAKKDTSVDLPRGSLLVIGGDLAYPTPTTSVWQTRFFDVYAQALPRSFSTKMHERQSCPRVVNGPTANGNTKTDDLGRTTPGTASRGLPRKDGMEAGYVKESRHDGDFPNTPHYTRNLSPNSLSNCDGNGTPTHDHLENAVDGVKDHQVCSAPLLFAIPGNHDWFDGCGTFRSFILSKSWCGGWFMPQKTSYFALAMPKDWFLFGLDNALADDIDPDQLVYFLTLVERNLNPNSSVIIVTHEPSWLNDHINVVEGEPHNQQRTQKLVNVLGNRLRVRLAGDIHNYSRYSPMRDGDTKKAESAAARLQGHYSDDPAKTPVTPTGDASTFPTTPTGVTNSSMGNNTSHYTSVDPDSPANANVEANYPQLIVSGGGGAFLHGSGVSARNVTYYGQHFQRRAWYPFGAKTISLFRRVFGFRLINWKFDIFGGVIYTMMIFSLLPLSPMVKSRTDVHSIADFMLAVVHTAMQLIYVIFNDTYFSAAVSVAVTVVMLIVINGKVSLWYRIPSGIFFGAMHVVCATLLVSFMHHALEQMTLHDMILSNKDEWRSFLHVELVSLYNSCIGLLEGWCKYNTDAKSDAGEEFNWWSYIAVPFLEPVVDLAHWAESKTYISTPISFSIRSLDVTETFEYLRLRVTANTTEFGQFGASATRIECLLYYAHFLWFYWLFATPAIACLLGFFLWFCVTVLNCGFDPAYSAFRIEDYKNFLRFRMNKKDGSLEVFVIGVDHVPRQWEADPKHLQEKERYHKVAAEAKHGNSTSTSAQGGGGPSSEEVPPAHLWDRPSLWRPKKQRNLQQKFPWTYHGPRIVERFTLQPTPKQESVKDTSLAQASPAKKGGDSNIAGCDSPRVTVMRRGLMDSQTK